MKKLKYCNCKHKVTNNQFTGVLIENDEDVSNYFDVVK